MSVGRELKAVSVEDVGLLIETCCSPSWGWWDLVEGLALEDFRALAFFGIEPMPRGLSIVFGKESLLLILVRLKTCFRRR